MDWLEFLAVEGTLKSLLQHNSSKASNPWHYLLSHPYMTTGKTKTLTRRTLKWVQFTSFQSFSHVWLFATPWTAACQASLSITNSRSPPKPMSVESVMPFNHLILCHPLPLPSIFPSISVFSNESVLCIQWPKYWSFSSLYKCKLSSQSCLFLDFELSGMVWYCINL